MTTLRAWPSSSIAGGLQLQADLLGDHLAAGEDRDVLQHGLATVAEARRLDGDGLEGAADLVHDQGREGLAVDVLGDDQQRLAGLHDLLEHGQEVLDVGDLLVGHEDVGVLEDGLHALGVGDEVRRDVALVEAHALGQLEVEPEGVGLLDGDDAFLADLVHRLRDGVTDGGVAAGRDRRGGRDLLAGLDVLGHAEQLLGDSLDGLLDAALERHRVRAGGHVAQALADHGLGEDGGRRRAVTGDVVGLLGDLLDELGPDLLVGVLQLDLLGDAHTIVGDGGRSPLLLEHDVAALGAQGDLDGVGEGVHPALETAAGLLVESNQLRHGFWWFLTLRRRRLAVLDGELAALAHCHSHPESANCIFSTRPKRVQTAAGPPVGLSASSPPRRQEPHLETTVTPFG